METINQLITISGARNTGKTRLAASFRPPSRIKEMVYADSEKSSNNVRDGLRKNDIDFGMYIDLEDVENRFSFPDNDDLLDRINRGETPWIGTTERDAMLEYYRYIVKTLTTIPRGKYSVFVLDTSEKLEYGMRAWADKNKAKFGLGSDWGKMEVGLVRPLYENLLNAIYGRGFETIIMNFHLRGVWDLVTKKPVPNKVKMGSGTVLYYRASLMLWLVNDISNPNGEPAALVIKERMGKFDVDKDNDKWVQQRMLPYRIPICDWEHINHYLDVGCNLSHPALGETWSEDERDMASEFYNNAQMTLMLKDLEIEQTKQAIAMAEMGGFATDGGNGVSIGAVKDAKPIVKSNNGVVPSNRAEAMTAWRNMGRKIPDFTGRWSMLQMEDEQLAYRWVEMIA